MRSAKVPNPEVAGSNPAYRHQELRVGAKGSSGLSRERAAADITIFCYAVQLLGLTLARSSHVVSDLSRNA